VASRLPFPPRNFPNKKEIPKYFLTWSGEKGSHCLLYLLKLTLSMLGVKIQKDDKRAWKAQLRADPTKQIALNYISIQHIKLKIKRMTLTYYAKG
jgi:hypothetical protein